MSGGQCDGSVSRMWAGDGRSRQAEAQVQSTLEERKRRDAEKRKQQDEKERKEKEAVEQPGPGAQS